MEVKPFPSPGESNLNPIINNNNNNNEFKNKRGIVFFDLPINSDDEACIVLDQDFVVHEILTRLPVKSLTRFKSVCKLWDSVIVKDGNFIDLHRTRSKSRNPNLLIVAKTTPPPRSLTSCSRQGVVFLSSSSPCKQSFMTVDLIEGGRGGASINTITDMYTPRFDTVTNSVNGLICFIDSISRQVQIYNISTRQKSPWIKNFYFFEGEMSGWTGPTYRFGFGFDPATNEHKLVCVRSSNTIVSYVCEVLTIIGDRVGEHNSNKLNQWRRIDEVPPQSVVNPSVHVNGTIYWSTCELAKGGEYWSKKHRPVSVVAFDVGSEKFRTVPIPDFILDQPMEHDEDAKVDLLEVDGHLALQIKMSRYVIKLFILNDEKKENKTTSDHQNWTEMTIKLPFRWRGDRFVRLHSVLDQIILLTDFVEQEYKEGNLLNEFQVKKKQKYFAKGGIKDESEVIKKPFSLYSYNRKKNTLEEFEIDGISTQISDISLFTTFDESLLHIPYLSNIANSSLEL